ncbi:MAG: hypothetical protein IKH34_07605 [Oscillospiraceae bacterium]|nr:hypothetical protein [Oscillospiraceae bacterium]
MKNEKLKTASVVGMCALFLLSCVLETAAAFKRAGIKPGEGKKNGK